MEAGTQPWITRCLWLVTPPVHVPLAAAAAATAVSRRRPHLTHNANPRGRRTFLMQQSDDLECRRYQRTLTLNPRADPQR